MKLTWKDGATTILAGLAVVAVVAALQGWGWPLLGSIAAGVGVITGSEGVLVALAAVTVLMWVASTSAHVMRGQPTTAMRSVSATR